MGAGLNWSRAMMRERAMRDLGCRIGKRRDGEEAEKRLVSMCTRRIRRPKRTGDRGSKPNGTLLRHNPYPNGLRAWRLLTRFCHSGKKQQPTRMHSQPEAPDRGNTTLRAFLRALRFKIPTSSALPVLILSLNLKLNN